MAAHTSAKGLRQGVSVRWLRNFAARIVREGAAHLNVGEVLEDFVIPSAAARKTRFTECGAVAHESVGVPDYYCVYVRSMNFCILVDSICQALADADWASVFIWIDIFGINWHATPELADPLNNSTAAMQACAGMLVVLDRSGQLFSRAWCLWEIWAMTRTHSTSSIVWVTCTPDDVELTEAATAALLQRQAAITASGGSAPSGRGSAGIAELDDFSSVGTSRASTAQGNYSVAASRITSNSGGPGGNLGSPAVGNLNGNGSVAAAPGAHSSAKVPAIGAAAAATAATASAGPSALNSPSSNQHAGGHAVPADPHAAHGLAPLSASLNSALKDTVAPGVREWGGVRFFCGRPWSMRGLSHLFHVDLRTAKCGDPAAKDRILAWIEGQGASTAREATLQLRVMLILQPTLEPYMDVAALKAAAKHGPHTPAPQAPGLVHPPESSLHINQHGAAGRSVWAGGPAAAAAAAQGHAGGGIPGADKYVRWLESVSINSGGSLTGPGAVSASSHSSGATETSPGGGVASERGAGGGGGDGHHRLLLISGPPGTGKSCFCASLCSSLLLTPAAAVFCKAADRSTGNAMTVIKSIAYQLAVNVPAFGHQLLSFLDAASVYKLTTPEEALALLVLRPLRAVLKAAQEAAQAASLRPSNLGAAASRHQRGGRGHDTNNDSGEWGEDEEAQAVPVDLPPHGLVIVIDGVEEVGGHTREDERDTTGCMRNQILHLICDMIWTLPSCVRLVVTVPPASSYPDLRAALAVLPHEVLTPADLLKPNDIQTSWLQQVSVAVNDPTECLEFSKTLWARARGDLLYGKLVVLNILLRHQVHLLNTAGKKARPEARSITLEQLCPTLPESLDAAYTSLFSACLTPTVIAHHHTLLTALCLLTAAEEPLNLNQLVGHGVVLSDLTLLPLWGTLFFVAENKVHMMHKSVMAYLTSPGPLQALGYDPAEGQEMLALHCHHSTRTSYWYCLYSTRYLPCHLLKAGHLQEFESVIQDLSYWERVYRLGLASAVLGDILRLVKDPSPVLLEMVQWLRSVNHVLVQHPVAVWQLALDAPTSSVVHSAAAGGLAEQRLAAAAAAGAANSAPGAASGANRGPGSSVKPVTASAAASTSAGDASALTSLAPNLPAYQPTASLLAPGEGLQQQFGGGPSSGFLASATVRPVSAQLAAVPSAWPALVARMPRLHADAICCVALPSVPEGSPLIATSSRDGTVRVWDLRAEPMLLCTLRGHSHAVDGLKWCGETSVPQERLLLSYSTSEQVVRVWDVCSGTEVASVSKIGVLTPAMLSQLRSTGKLEFMMTTSRFVVRVHLDSSIELLEVTGPPGTHNLADPDARVQLAKLRVDTLRYGKVRELKAVIEELLREQVECMAQSVDRAVIACACGRDLLLWDYAKLVELADEPELRHTISVPGSILSLMDYTPALEHTLHDKRRQLASWHALMAASESQDCKGQGQDGHPTTSHELSQLQLQMSQMQLPLDPAPHQHASPHADYKLPPSLPEIHASSSREGSSKSVGQGPPVGSRGSKSMMGATSSKSILHSSRHLENSFNSGAGKGSSVSGSAAAKGPGPESQQEGPPPLQQPLVVAAVQADAGPVRVLATDTRRPVAVMRTHRRASKGGVVRCVRVSPDGALIATGGQDGIVRVWSAHAYLQHQPPPPPPQEEEMVDEERALNKGGSSVGAVSKSRLQWQGDSPKSASSRRTSMQDSRKSGGGGASLLSESANSRGAPAGANSSRQLRFASSQSEGGAGSRSMQSNRSMRSMNSVGGASSSAHRSQGQPEAQPPAPPDPSKGNCRLLLELKGHIAPITALVFLQYVGRQGHAGASTTATSPGRSTSPPGRGASGPNQQSPSLAPHHCYLVSGSADESIRVWDLSDLAHAAQALAVHESRPTTADAAGTADPPHTGSTAAAGGGAGPTVLTISAKGGDPDAQLGDGEGGEGAAGSAEEGMGAGGDTGTTGEGGAAVQAGAGQGPPGTAGTAKGGSRSRSLSPNKRNSKLGSSKGGGGSSGKKKGAKINYAMSPEAFKASLGGQLKDGGIAGRIQHKAAAAAAGRALLAGGSVLRPPSAHKPLAQPAVIPKGAFQIETTRVYDHIAQRILDRHEVRPVADPLVAVLEGHERGVTTLDASPNGVQFASGSLDCSVRVWRSKGRLWEQRALLSGHAGPITSLAFNTDGDLLASGASLSEAGQASVKVWRPATGQLLLSLPHFHLVSWALAPPAANHPNGTAAGASFKQGPSPQLQGKGLSSGVLGHSQPPALALPGAGGVHNTKDGLTAAAVIQPMEYLALGSESCVRVVYLVPAPEPSPTSSQQTTPRSPRLLPGSPALSPGAHGNFRNSLVHRAGGAGVAGLGASVNARSRALAFADKLAACRVADCYTAHRTQHLAMSEGGHLVTADHGHMHSHVLLPFQAALSSTGLGFRGFNPLSSTSAPPADGQQQQQQQQGQVPAGPTGPRYHLHWEQEAQELGELRAQLEETVEAYEAWAAEQADQNGEEDDATTVASSSGGIGMPQKWRDLESRVPVLESWRSALDAPSQDT